MRSPWHRFQRRLAQAAAVLGTVPLVASGGAAPAAAGGHMIPAIASAEAHGRLVVATPNVPAAGAAAASAATPAAIGSGAPAAARTAPLRAAAPGAVAGAAAAVQPSARSIAVHSQAAVKRVAAAGQVLFTCQAPPPGGLYCYGPGQIRAAYDVQSVLDRGIAGRGRTIAIIDAFQSPTIAQDLQLFDHVFGLPDPAFKVFAPDGLTPFDPKNPNQVGWSGEISLDVQWAHAIAPEAAIDLVLARSDQDADILSAMRYAIDHRLGDVVSMSFGEGERCMDPRIQRAQHQLFRRATAQGITLFASSGDFGAGQPVCSDPTRLFLSASTPASDPFVTGVGGTTLTADLTTGAYRSETAWHDPFGESGGGYSVLYGHPDYQEDVPRTDRSRAVPDVAWDAGVFGGVLTAWGVPFGPGAFFVFGGTSAGAPQWAGVTALADQQGQRRLGFLNDAIYQIGMDHEQYGRDFHDVTAGDNVVPGVGGYQAGRGWDPVTGWGSPDVARLLARLAPSDEDGQGDQDGQDADDQQRPDPPGDVPPPPDPK